MLNIIDWITIVIFGGATLVIGFAALLFLVAIACDNSHDSFY